MILDALLACLLLATIGYSWKLSRKVSAINDSRKELENFIKEFNTAISRAEVSIATLRTLSSDTDVSLKSHIEKARFLTNDLAFFTYKGNSVANRLESRISESRMVDPDPMGLKSGKTAAEPDDAAKSAVWKFPEKPAQPIKKSSEMSPSKKQALDSALALLAKRKKPEVDAPREEKKIIPGVTQRPAAAKPADTKGDIVNVRQSVDSLRTSLEMKS
ncbi:MAG: hypothetical protein EB060_02780 [Proteobacteria bacterium]|nr:hypothetical protein [Pseudomonadota bacterium]